MEEDKNIELEEKNKRYICMVCGALYDHNYMPIYNESVDGCCSAGSLIEIDI